MASGRRVSVSAGCSRFRIRDQDDIVAPSDLG